MKKYRVCFIAILSLILTPQLALAEESSTGTIIELSSIGIFTLILAALSVKKDSISSPKLKAFVNRFDKRK